MKFYSLLAALAAVPLTTANPVPVVTDISIHESTDADVEKNITENPAYGATRLLKRDSYSCGGSVLCPLLTQVPYDWMKTACTKAWARYDDNTWYKQYTSRVSDPCTAIYTCDNEADYGGGWPGWFLKQK